MCAWTFGEWLFRIKKAWPGQGWEKAYLEEFHGDQERALLKYLDFVAEFHALPPEALASIKVIAVRGKRYSLLEFTPYHAGAIRIYNDGHGSVLGSLGLLRRLGLFGELGGLIRQCLGLLGQRKQGLERAGLRAGDWARATSRDGVEWQDVRSMIDLRWEVTQAALREHGREPDLEADPHFVDTGDGLHGRFGLAKDLLAYRGVFSLETDDEGDGAVFDREVLDESERNDVTRKAWKADLLQCVKYLFLCWHFSPPAAISHVTRE